ncbi:unnamed protein product [Anisakis simplex]|uniref:Uncharacterized protein n=1 Tax=Anisakis simplex TaxID=6269 RepID=A0A0M3JXD2_ANISI|nr:unnamed protein product [Anisakis simplex]
MRAFFTSDPKTPINRSPILQLTRLNRLRRHDRASCNFQIYLNQPLHAIMDRVCVICHEMFSHERPNMRVECRSNCFRSEHFRKCLDMFRPNQEAQVLLKGSSS